jgi:iron(III) transport system permease protein
VSRTTALPARVVPPARVDSVGLFAIGIGLVLAFLALYPTFMLFYGSVSSAPLGLPGTFTLEHYRTAYGDPETYRLLANSFLFAGGSALLSLLFAGVLAWITIRTNAPGAGLFEMVALVPNVLPPLLISTSWVLLLSPRIGLINVVLARVGIPPFNVYSMGGMIFVEGLVLTPLAYLIISAAMRSMDPALEEAARIAGSSTLAAARRVTVPLIRPALLAAGALNFVRALESFDTPAIIAIPARLDVLTTKIYREAISVSPPNHNLAATYGMSLLIITLTLVYLYRRLTARSERFATITGRGYRPHTIDLGRWRYAGSAAAVLILGMIVALPFLVLVLTSLLPFYEVPTWATLKVLTLKHYDYLLHSERVARAFQVSGVLATVGATAAMILASAIGYLTVRTKLRGRGILDALTFIPWAFPGTALAIGLLWGYVRLPIAVYATIWILLIGYVTRFLPYGLRTMTSTMVQVHTELEEASRVCGAGVLATFRRILLPLLRPGFMAGWAILATIFMREFSLSLFLYTPASEPLGPLLYHFWIDAQAGRMAALGVMVSLASVALVTVARRVSRGAVRAEG